MVGAGERSLREPVLRSAVPHLASKHPLDVFLIQYVLEIHGWETGKNYRSPSATPN